MKNGGHNYTAVSKAIGKNPTYVQQWVRYATPKELPDRLRRKLADVLGLEEKLLAEPDIEALQNQVIGGIGLVSNGRLARARAALRELEGPRRLAIASAPVRGETAAGVWMEFNTFDEEKYEAVPYLTTRYGDLEQFAFYVNGSSMDKSRILDGDYVICVSYSIVRAIPQSGDIVVVERRRGGLFERTCKKLELVEGSLALMSNSNDPRYKDPISLGGDPDGTEVEVIGLVIGTYRPFF